MSKNFLQRAAPGVHDAVISLLLEKLAPGSSVLDIGTGQGAVAQTLCDYGFNVTAVDNNPSDFRSPDALFHELDLNDGASVKHFSNAHEGRYDAVIAVEVIEHIENPWSLVRLMHSCAREQGLLVCTTPNVGSWHSRLKFVLSGTYDEFSYTSQPGHINPVSEWELKLLFETMGARQLSISPAGKVYDQPSLAQRMFEATAAILRPFQAGTISGYCLVVSSTK